MATIRQTAMYRSHEFSKTVIECSVRKGRSMSEKRWLCLAPGVVAILMSVQVARALDVLHYAATLEPDIAAKSVKGTVRIRFVADTPAVEFNCGDLTIDSVRLGGAALKFSVLDHHLRVSIPKRAQEIDIEFHGTPKRGIRFFPDRQQVYTIFSPSKWMFCVNDPSDKASLTFKLILPANLTPIANGQLVSQRELPNNRRVSEWQQRTPIPTYVFGFAAGLSPHFQEKNGNNWRQNTC